MSDITFQYQGDTLATMDASGTAIINTAGCYCEGNITVNYVKPSSGVTPAPSKDVNFVDHDGTILYSYTAAEFAALTELPANPTHDGLTAQGWNWSLADAKAQVLVSGILDIGQMYVTSDGKTRIYIRISDEGRMNYKVFFKQTVENGVTLGWGDGSTAETYSGTGNKNATHTYTDIGDYVITFEVTDGTLTLGNGSASSPVVVGSDSLNPYRGSVVKAEIGSNCELADSAFYNNFGLQSITLPQTLTAIGASTFYSCYSLRYVAFPNQITSIGSAMFRVCYALNHVSLPKSVVSFPSANVFYNTGSLQRIALPPITSIPSSCFNGNTNLSSLVIPSSVTDIQASAFSGCTGLGELHFKGTTPPTVANSNAFTNLPTDCKIYVPSGYLSAYTSASNYPSSATYTYVEE